MNSLFLSQFHNVGHSSSFMTVSVFRFAAFVGASESNGFSLDPLAHWIARWTSNPKVAGSIPARVEVLLFLYMLKN